MITPLRTEKLDPASLSLPQEYIFNEERLNLMLSSIRDKGLLHPPCVKEDSSVFAGKVRVRACQLLKLELIECHIYPSGLEADEYTEIALHENLKRFNLPWDEQVTAEKELHDLRQAQNGEGKRGKKVGWSLRDTAEELQMSFGVLSEDLRMAQAIEQDPTLRRIKDKGTARRVILEQIKRSNQELSASIPSQVEVNVCLFGGSEIILKQYPDSTFDACITDPPWLEFKDKNLIRDEFTLKVFVEVFRTLKANSFLYAFVGMQDWLYYQENLTKIGFSVQKYPLVWVKEGVLTYGTRLWEHQRDYELIILAVKGSPALTSNMQSSVMSCKVVPSGKLIHPNEKPPEIIRRLLDYCTYDGSLVLDPFAGSFVVADVCRSMRRRFVAIENDKTYYHQGIERMKKICPEHAC